VTIPADWGLGEYTTAELRSAEAHAREQMAGELEPGDMERLAKRLAAIKAEREDREVHAAALKAAALKGGYGR
jgi:hypothetical protein